MSAKDQGDRVAFQVQDNGQGFDPAEVQTRELSRRGLGLAAMAERVNLLGGTFTVRSQLGAGTIISFIIPKDVEV